MCQNRGSPKLLKSFQVIGQRKRPLSDFNPRNRTQHHPRKTSTQDSSPASEFRKKTRISQNTLIWNRRNCLKTLECYVFGGLSVGPKLRQGLACPLLEFETSTIRQEIRIGSTRKNLHHFNLAEKYLTRLRPPATLNLFCRLNGTMMKNQNSKKIETTNKTS